MSPEDQARILDRIFAKLDDPSREQASDVLHVDVRRYTSDDWFENECGRLFASVPSMLVHSSDLPGPHAFVTMQHFGKSLLVCRNAEGRAHAFLNVCRHRGATLENENRGCKRRFVCPYHAWNYDSEGKLTGLPRPECFPGVEIGERNLFELNVIEAYGFVWLMPKPEDAAETLVAFLGGIEPDLAALGLEDFQVFGEEQQVWKTNWKLVVEGTLEGYHFPYLHRTSAHAVFEGNCVIFDRFGPHLRTFLAKRSLRQMRDVPLDSFALTERGNVIYTLLPNETVLHQSDHFLWITPVPIAPDETLVKLRLLIPKDKMDEDSLEFWEDNRKFTYQVQYEDLEIYEAIQAGFASNAAKELIFGTNESALHAFTENVDSYTLGNRAV